MKSQISKSYHNLLNLLEEDVCVIMGGGVATELCRLDLPDYKVGDQSQWGTSALFKYPQAVLEVHQHYVSTNCDLISSATWGILNTPPMEAISLTEESELSHWLDGARMGVRLARKAIAAMGRENLCAVAFSVNGDVTSRDQLERFLLLPRVFKEDPPDLILMETMTLFRDNLTLPAVEAMLQTGIPLWLSFRRSLKGVCGIFGQHWGGPEGDLFGRMASRFESMGVGAILINSIPVQHLEGMLPWLRDFTDLPLGVYPNVGHYLEPGWKFDEEMTPGKFAALALHWRGEGARIIGGCNGVSPEHIIALKNHMQDSKSGEKNGSALPNQRKLLSPAKTSAESHFTPPEWVDRKGRSLYPLCFPEIEVDPGVFRPTQGSFLIWKFLFNSGLGKGKRCLDVGCGTGILTVQLALNGAENVQATDIQEEAVTNTMANAFRNGVAGNVTGTVIDLYTQLPDQQYDIIVASLYQMPVDPMNAKSSARPTDFWGRNLIDHLISLLPDLLEKDGLAYLMQVSVLSRLETVKLLHQAGFECKVIDFSLFHFGPDFYENFDQIKKVEEISDAFHLSFSEDQAMVMYLLEVTWRRE